MGEERGVNITTGVGTRFSNVQYNRTNSKMSSNSHDSYDKVDMKDDDFGIRQNSVTYVKKNDLLWASSAFIPGEDVDECEAADDVGNEPEIKTNKIQANIMGSATT